jgi:hypothetical protein
LSIISGTATDRAEQAAAVGDSPRTLPQVPRVRRATGDDAPVRNEARAGWNERQATTMRRNAPQEMPQSRPMPAEAVERAESFRAMPQQAPRMPQREAVPYERNVRSMDAAPRPAYVPRQQPTPAAMPQPRMVAPPARSENAQPARSDGNARKPHPRDDRYRKDDQQ